MACPPAQGYFAAHTCSLKACSDQQPLAQQQQELVAAQQQQQELTRTAQLALRNIRETEASHAHGSSGREQFNQDTQEGALASTLLALAFLTRISCNVGPNSDAAADHQTNINPAVVCV